MVGRNKLLEVGQCAARVLRNSGTADRIKQGYTRVDPLQIADQSEVWVMLQPMEALLGAFVRLDEPGILINAERPPGMIHMTAAHELGHFFLGHETTWDQQLDYDSGAEDKEREADWFAYHLLMPRWLVVDVIKRKGWGSRLNDPSTLYQLSLRLGTSYTATIWTLRQLNLLNISLAEARRLARISPQSLKRELVGGGEGTPSDVWILDSADKDLILEPRPDDQFVLEVSSHASAGYLWCLDEAARAGYKMHPLTRIAEPNEPKFEGPVVVGAAARQRYLLDPVESKEDETKPDRIDLDFRQRRPWRANAPDLSSFRTSAEFETLEEGLSAMARVRLVDEVSSS